MEQGDGWTLFWAVLIGGMLTFDLGTAGIAAFIFIIWLDLRLK